MNDRFLTLLNLALLGVCGFCVWYLATVDYSEPREVKEMKVLLADTDFNGTTDTIYDPPPQTTPLPGFDKTKLFDPPFTPTPTPTPTPEPTPEPGNLAAAVASWTLVGITDEKTVELMETRDPNSAPFTMTVGGPTVPAKDAKGTEVQVQLISVDMDNYRVKLGFMEQTEEKAM
jgi:hypothetical protein